MNSDDQKGPQSVADAEAFAADLDVGARNPVIGWQAGLIAAVALTWAFAQVFNASPMPALLAGWTGWNWIYVNSDVERVLHLAFGLTLATLAFPMFKSSPRDRIPIYDWVLIAAGLYATLYLLWNQSAIADRPGLWTTGDVVASGIGLVVVLLATYRALGLPMVIVAFFFLMYVFFGDAEFFPDAMQWKGASFSKAMGHFWMQTEGVFGLALGVSASMVFLFVLFGSLLEKAGAGNYFIKLAFALMGHLKGGPAKAAVVASAATGLISGSSIANTVTTGTFTIPLMKRVGFPAEKAGAVEVASSTNGQLTPPVMGAAAFLMVEYVGISYLEVVKHAFLPAIISYIALVYIVHLEAAKMGLEGLPRSGPVRALTQKLMNFMLGVAVFCALCLGIYYGLGWLKPLLGKYSLPGMMVLFFAAYLVLLKWAAGYPDLEIDDPNAPFKELPEPGPVAKTGYYYILPVVVLIWNLMIERLSPGLSAFWATLAMIFVMLTQHPLKAMFRGEGLSDWARGWREFLDGMISGSRNMIGIAVATGTAGIIVGTVSLTGAHQVIGEFIEVISGGNLLLMLIFVALFSLVLGMGLPTTATYIVITSLMAPVIIAVGAKSGLIVPLIAVHMFVFYFGILADDTPPVGLAAFAAAAISKGDPIKTGIIGFSYDVRTAILPFLFIFNTELLLIDVTWQKAIFVFIVAVVAMMLFAAATQSWFLTRSKMWENLALLLIAFTLFRPGFWLDMVEEPYVLVDAAQVNELATAAEDGASLRAVLQGENFATGEIDTTTVSLALGNKADGDGEARLDRHAGIAFRTEDDGKVYVDNLAFGGDLQKQGIDFDWELLRIEQEARRMPKEVFYLPALALLGLIVFLQLGRARRAAAQPA
ncbi:TRAP transporter permease [Marimonas arenosa]|uniref:TRAP transporter permease n=1 Tax=Marimonas arenosa TaxID=1795305 RepID=A0AAE4B3M6_9RHOB|nr:TRAP transporter permease [Marimonas arenosa]MDQ2090228.1 TRAP transporter permease [Marimonas arenosa]